MTILLKWTARVDMDLWVLEPNGNPDTESDWVSYKKHRGAGKLSPDNTTGGGTSFEKYEVTNGPRGIYRVRVVFFADHRATAEGRGDPVDIQLIVTRNGAPTIYTQRFNRAGDVAPLGPIWSN